jgi:hypothetical protein
MLKPLTLSLSLAVALGFCSVSMAGGHDGCTTCGLASPQGGLYPSAQYPIDTHCETPCCPPKHHCFADFCCKLKELCHPPVCYEWVLKKKRLWGHHGHCDTCPTDYHSYDHPIYPTGQGGYAAPSGQGGYAAPQAAPVYGAGQHTYRAARPAPTIASVPAQMTPAVAGEEAPPAPEVKETSGLLLPTPSGN